MTKEYSMAMSEVACIIEQSNDNYRSKIPNKFLQFVLQHSDKTYQPQFDVNTPLKDLPLKKETKGILALIYRSYICNPDERKEYDKLLKENEEKHQKALNEKYDIDKIFEARQQEAAAIAQEAIEPMPDNNQTSMVEYKEESFIKKIFNKIKSFFGFGKR